MRAIILNGGKGSRLRPLTNQTPKAILPLNNRPFCLYQIDWLKKYGIREVTFAIGYLGDKIKKILGDGSKFGIYINYATENYPLDTAGAIRNVFDSLKNIDFRSPFIVLNGDILTDIDISKLLDFHFKKNSLITICLVESSNFFSYGVVSFASNGKILEFNEKPKDLKDRDKVFINAGIYVIQPEMIEYIPKGKKYSFEREFIPDIISKGFSIYAYKTKGYWIDIGTPERYKKAQEDILKIKL